MRGDWSTDSGEVSFRSDIWRIFTQVQLRHYRGSASLSSMRTVSSPPRASRWIAENWFKDLCRQDPVAMDTPSITIQQRSKRRLCYRGRRRRSPVGLTAGLKANPQRTPLPSILLSNVRNLHAVVFFLSCTILRHWNQILFPLHCKV